MIRGKKHIMLCIPAVGTTVSTAVASFTTKVISESMKRGCPYRFSVSYLVDVKPTEYARNILVTQALKRKDVDAIWFIDSDMVPSSNSLELLNVNADIAVGMAPIFSSRTLNKPSFSYNVYKYVPNEDGLDFMPVLPSKNMKIMNIDGAGCACMLIQRHVLENKKLWLEPKKVKGVIPLFRWPRSITGESMGTDDLDFCRRIRPFKYTIKCDPRIVWGHLKSLDLEWMIRKLAYTYKSTKEQKTSPLTINDHNKKALKSRKDPLKVVEQKPSGEVGAEYPVKTLISPTAGEVMDSCIGE